MSKVYEFTIRRVGEGDTPEDAWADCKDSTQFEELVLEDTEYVVICEEQSPTSELETK